MNHETIIVEGCPVADGGPPCCRNCGGGWPRTKITTVAMTRAVRIQRIDPSRLGCQPLQDRATEGLHRAREALLQDKDAIITHGTIELGSR